MKISDDPRGLVALILAAAFLLFVLMSGANHLVGHGPLPENIASAWSDLMSVMLGGLLGYCASSGGNPK